MSVKLELLNQVAGNLKLAIKLEMLRCFALVAQTGNLADAAARLGRTQSAVSMTLKQLEEDLGQRLFQGERKSRLTPLGEQVFTLAQQQVAQFDMTVREIQTSATAPKGLLRIVSIPSVTGRLLPRAVDAMIGRHDGLKIDIRDTDTALVLDALVRGQADLGIVSGSPQVSGMEREVLFEDRFGVTAARDHQLVSQGGPVPLDALIGPGLVSNTLLNRLEVPALRDALATTRLHAHNTHSLIGMLLTGKWFSILPEGVVKDLPGALSFVPIADLQATRRVTALIPERSSQADAARELAQVLKDLARADI